MKNKQQLFSFIKNLRSLFFRNRRICSRNSDQHKKGGKNVEVHFEINSEYIYFLVKKVVFRFSVVYK